VVAAEEGYLEKGIVYIGIFFNYFSKKH